MEPNDLVFVHMPRTGGTSLMDTLEKKGVKVITHNIRDPDYVWLKDYLKNSNGQKYVVAFTRNPWDKVVSAFFYLNKGGNNPEDDKDRVHYLSKYNGDFREFVINAFKDEEILEQMHFMPQYKWISDDEGNILVDFLGKFENYYKDLKKVSQEIGIDLTEGLPKTNASSHRHYREHYDEETKEIIRKAYKKDIELFGYEF